jgi:hypothetical protein
MPKRTPGRPSKLTPEIQDRICASLRAGNFAVVACQAAGISESTLLQLAGAGQARSERTVFGVFGGCHARGDGGRGRGAGELAGADAKRLAGLPVIFGAQVR